MPSEDFPRVKVYEELKYVRSGSFMSHGRLPLRVDDSFKRDSRGLRELIRSTVNYEAQISPYLDLEPIQTFEALIENLTPTLLVQTLESGKKRLYLGEMEQGPKFVQTLGTCFFIPKEINTKSALSIEEKALNIGDLTWIIDKIVVKNGVKRQ